MTCSICEHEVQAAHLIIRGVPGPAPAAAQGDVSVAGGVVVHVGPTVTEHLCGACLPRFERAWAAALAAHPADGDPSAFVRRYAIARSQARGSA